MALLLGCIADDFTGATDLSNTLVRHGMRTVQLFGVPPRTMGVADAEAIVVALKSRTIDPHEAVSQSLAALDWLRVGGAQQIFFKYCSTFDSTSEGNIGPVSDALLEALGEEFTIACPAFPENGRTVCHGYLFVGDVLLSESGMRDHPLTPMTDANLRRVLGAQTPHPVGLVPYTTVEAGPSAIQEAFEALKGQDVRHAVVDALADRHLLDIGHAAAGLKLLTGGSGLASGLPENFRRAGSLPSADAEALPAVAGAAAVISGSCSEATRAQVAHRAALGPAFEVDALEVADGRDVAREALEWARPRLGEQPLLFYSTAPPEKVREVQRRLGRERAGELVEASLAAIAHELVEAGARRLVIAGGETSGAVLEALGISSIRIGAQIDPGVPWTVTTSRPHLALALKSGNFGTEDFFTKAFDRLP